ncbi:MAG: HNH endonuclease [Spirochaetota bacterium]|nr:HNH endonuclease [Spirochaetota bacterium]
MSYSELGRIENINITDSWVKYNKVGEGSGEARLYVGQNSEKHVFFTSTNQSIFTAFVLKKDLAQYLNDAEFEYQNPSNDYRNRESLYENFITYKQKLYDLPNIIYFDFEFAPDTAQDQNRCYIRALDTSNNSIYTFLREILFPNLTKIDIVKINFDNDRIEFYYIPKLEIQYNHYQQLTRLKNLEDTITESKSIEPTENEQLILSRRGQGRFRANLIEEMVCCPLTNVNDSRLLLASHIKPWAESNNEERLDHYNGLLLTPTFDKLFDQGLITFTNPTQILFSSHLSEQTIELLKLREFTPNINHFDLREQYFIYHHLNIFKG